jgi:hypothetical protein
MNFEVEKELIEVPATTLNQPTLCFNSAASPKNKSKEITKTPNLGHWDLRNVEFVDTPKGLGSIHVLALPGCFGKSTGDMNNVLGKFHTKLTRHGIAMKRGEAADEALLPERKSPAPGTPITPELLIKIHLNVVHRGSEDCSVILIPEKNYDLYAYANQLCDFARRHILFATGSKFLKGGAEQFMSNLALKVNMKFGGQSHHFKPAELNKLLPQIGAKIIVLGADIGHSGTGGKEGSPSVACVVGSTASDFMLYPGSMRLQAGGQEVSTWMASLRRLY